MLQRGCLVSPELSCNQPRWGRESWLLCLSSWCLVIFVLLFITMPQVWLHFVIVVFPDHTHYFWCPCCLVLDCSKFYSTSLQSVTSALSVFQRFLNCQTKRILIGRFALLLSFIDVRNGGMVSKAAVKMCPCFHTCWITRFNNNASNWSLHVTLAVNKTLKISQVGRPSVVNKQKKWVSNTKAGHKSRNPVNVDGFFLQTGRLNNHFWPY